MSIEELEQWFATAKPPIVPVYLHESVKVLDYEHFVKSHFDGIKGNDNPRVRQPLIDRLLDMKLLIEANLEK